MRFAQIFASIEQSTSAPAGQIGWAGFDSVPLVVLRMAAALILLFFCNVVTAAEEVPRVRFNRDVRPILADKCFHCHGPDSNQRQANLRLDDPENVLELRDGYCIIDPGHAEKSELYRRISAKSPSLQMPPADQERQLSEEEIETLRRWIEGGAEYEPHWAFLPPKWPQIPEVTHKTWPRNGIDRFVLARFEDEGFEPSPQADKTTLIRRVTLDLTGLPPTPEEVDAFLADDSPNAYERLVDRLLASPRYGERMARVWLDAARYADSGGYQGDILRTMWPWRDWVINAYNSGMPFDQFTIEQLAGDLLPNPSREQLVATGFNRNHRINDEDGIILEEFRVEYVADRTETTATVWMGLTFGCARCHDHKYDPITQRDYYRLFAYFNSVDEKGRGHGNAPPLLHLPTPKQQARLSAIDSELETLRKQQAQNSSGDPTTNDAKSEVQIAQSEDSQAEESPSKTINEQIKALEKRRQALMKSVVNTMIMRDLPEPRQTFVLTRGAYNKPAEPVTPGVPEVLSPLPDDAPSNRLALAKWLVNPDHPLTARVAVNRYWQMYFGRGLVNTPEDFGTQGDLPSHPKLLDWLAREFIRTGWDVKAMQRLIVTSATYRQSSDGSPELYRRDPENRLLVRGPRFRMPAEILRDQALFASGLLVEQLGGPSVKPYQPPDLWKELASAHRNYVQDHGPDLYRRSLYTFIRRTVPPPAMSVLDAPNREICTLRRARTNTPTQALALMNDPTYVEAARKLSERILNEAGASEEDRLRHAFRRLLVRSPTPEELAVLSQALQEYRQRYQAAPDAAKELLSVGESKRNQEHQAGELAAYTAVVSLLLNLDETLTKE